MAETMIERLRRHKCSQPKHVTPWGTHYFHQEDVESFAESELRRALQPSAPSPELDDRTMTRLRLVCPAGWNEVVRARAEIARLTAELESARDRVTSLELAERGL